VGVDILGPYVLPNREQKVAIIMIDYFTNSVIIKGMKDMSAEAALEKLIIHVFDARSVPKYIIGDRCSQFLGEQAVKVFNDYSTDFLPSIAYHHQGNAKVERLVRTAKPNIKACIDAKMSWRSAVRKTENMVNNFLVNDSSNLTPIEMEKGFTYNSAMDNLIRKRMNQVKVLQAEAREEIGRRKKKQEEYYNKGKKIRRFKVGDLVMYTNHHKKTVSDDFRTGPFRVEKVLSDHNYLLYDSNTKKWFDANIQDLFWPGDQENIAILNNLNKNKIPVGFKDTILERVVDLPGLEVPVPVPVLEDPRNMGTEVKVWFEDKKKMFKGVITGIADVGRYGNDSYWVLFGKNKEKHELVKLDLTNRDDSMQDKANTDRWTIVQNL